MTGSEITSIFRVDKYVVLNGIEFHSFFWWSALCYQNLEKNMMVSTLFSSTDFGSFSRPDMFSNQNLGMKSIFNSKLYAWNSSSTPYYDLKPLFNSKIWLLNQYSTPKSIFYGWFQLHEELSLFYLQGWSWNQLQKGFISTPVI